MQVAGPTALLIALFCTCAVAAQARVAPELRPAGDAAAALPRLRSLVVSWRGNVVLERYYNGATRDRLANIKSASKSVISTLVGIALERQLIPGIKTFGRLR